MLDLNNILNISREQFDKLNTAEKQVVLEILQEM